MLQCARLYNDYKCWNSTRTCEFLNDQTKCSAYEKPVKIVCNRDNGRCIGTRCKYVEKCRKEVSHV